MAMTEQVPLQVFIYLGIILFSLVDFIKTEDVPYTLLNEPSNLNPVISFDGHYINKRQAPSPSTTSPGTTSGPGAQSTQSTSTLSTIDIKDQGSHKYYTSKVVLSDKYWDELNDLPAQHASLTNGHRIAVTVGLTFGFPFYGHTVKKVTIATGGFLYMSPFLHSWLTATQYIAPLMANFDTTIGNGSDILYKDYTDRFVVEWRDVYLQDQNHTNPFSFQTTLHKNGSIVFGYRQVPLDVTEIITANHPVKIGVSDAFYVDATVNGITRRTIYEYHRVEVNLTLIEENTVVLLEPLLTCNVASNCETCIQQNANFECKWCSAISRCSDGIDWHRQEWLKAGCTSLAHDTVSRCNETYTTTKKPTDTTCDPMVSEKCAKSPSTLSTRTTTITKTSTKPTMVTTKPTKVKTKPTTVTTKPSTVTTKPTSPMLKHSSLQRTSSTVKPSEKVSTICDSSSISSGKGSCSEMQRQKNTQQAVGGIIGIVLVLLILIVAIVGWFVYAYRNPTSASGMWLMEHRPSVMKQKIANMKFWKRTTETGDKYKIESSASEA